jgi:hypothetical protein
MMKNVWGTVKEVTHNSKKYYVFNANKFPTSSLPISFVPTQPGRMNLQDDVARFLVKNKTNEFLRIWTGGDKLITFEPHKEKHISWNFESPLMVLTKDASADLDKNTYLEVIQKVTPS